MVRHGAICIPAGLLTIPISLIVGLTAVSRSSLLRFASYGVANAIAFPCTPTRGVRDIFHRRDWYKPMIRTTPMAIIMTCTYPICQTRSALW